MGGITEFTCCCNSLGILDLLLELNMGAAGERRAEAVGIQYWADARRIAGDL